MDGALLPTAALTASGRPVLLPDEFECSLLSPVDLESEESPAFPRLKAGLLILTTHRLIWISEGGTPVAVFVPLDAVTHIFFPKKSIKSMFSSPRIRFQVSVSSDGRVLERPLKGTRSVVITLVVRGKGDCDVFLAKLCEAWKGMAWENRDSVSNSSAGGAESSVESTGGVRMVGVSGILRREQEIWENTDKSLQDAFQDLNALMSKAKEMVMLADKMRQKLLSCSNLQASGTNDEDMDSNQEMQDWLLSVGIISPVTKESAGALYHQQLSRQLADFVRTPLEIAGGMINLTDIYCLFNRARGTELISPDDLLQACLLWEKFNVPVILRKFDSGIMVIQNKSQSDEEVFSKIKSLSLKPDALRYGISASDAAIALGIAPAMAKEHLVSAESKGLLCRDISPDGFRFYVNLFHEINSDDIYLLKDQGIYATWVIAACASK